MSAPELTTFPAQTQNRAVPDSYAARLAEITLPDADGQQVRLGTLWSTHPAVVVFLRHYG